MAWLEIQASFTRRCRNSLHSPMIEKTITVKNNPLNPLLLRLSGENLTDKRRARDIPAVYTPGTKFTSYGRRRNQNAI